MKSFPKSVLASALTAFILMSMAGVAGAVPPEKQSFVEHFDEHEEILYEADVDPDFCPGLGFDVLFVRDETGTFVWRRQGGPNGQFYGQATVHGITSFTNPANNKSFTFVTNHIDKDLKVTDNGDGTRTILVLVTGAGNILGSDGKAVLRDPGQVRFEIVISDNGTPADPTDDEFVEFLGLVKGSTGRNDTDGREFCDDLQLFIG